MHPNPAFRKTPEDRNLAFARERGFGALVVNGAEEPLVAHVPFVLSAGGLLLEAHLLRSNPVWAAIDAPRPAKMIVSGPDGYISPDWYEVPDQVPTWNYVAVHLAGTLRRSPQARLEPHSAELSAEFEERLLPKTPWTLEKMDRGVLERMQRMIVPVALDIARVDGTWKLNQNKPDEVRLRAAERVEASSGQELAALADLMRSPPE
ncbi:MAG: FMN-binding negative transcriptional regulator [Pseudomonadota bacterium]